MSTSRNFILTVNPASLEFYEDIRNYLMHLKGLAYILVTEHFGQEQQHYHIFVQYTNTKRLCIRKLHGAHIEPCYGSAQANIAYCRAEDDKHKRAGVTAAVIFEEGEPLLKGGNFTVGYLEELEDPNELPAVFYNTFKKIRSEKRNRISIATWRKGVKVYYIQGPSAIGKSQKAEELIKLWYMNKGIEEEDQMYFDEVKYDKNGFYQGICEDNPCEVAVFDDFRAGIMKPEEFINLIDYRVHNLNIKGGSVKNKYQLIIFTSVQKLRDIYKNVESFERREQWERRIEVVDMYPPERVSIGGLPVGYITNFNNFDNYSLEVNDPSDSSRVVLH